MSLMRSIFIIGDNGHDIVKIVISSVDHYWSLLVIWGHRGTGSHRDGGTGSHRDGVTEGHTETER